MPHRYFTTEISDGTATLRGADAHHLARVMRARLGDTVILCDGNAVEYTATITGFGDECVEFRVEPGYPSAAEPSVEVTLLAGYPKQDKLEQIIKHGVELGAAHIVPFFSRYCVAAPKKEEQKNERYNRIALEAAKQCGRGVLPDVALPLPNFGAVCRSFDQYDLVLFCYECGGAPLRQLLADAKPADGQKLRLAIVTGAEGGFAAEEAEMAAKAGITCFATGPGSSDAIGGTFAAVKPMGKRIDNMILKYPIAMKCAFGENPKRRYMTSRMSTRMTNAALIREALQKAALYMAKKEAAGDDVSKLPAFDQKSESLIPVLKGELPLKAHAHQANDIFTAIRIAKEFHTKLTLEHVTEGHLIVEELVKENLPLAVGPTFGHATKVELLNKSWTTPGILAKAGCHVSIISDAPVTPLHNLPLYAGMAMKAGMDPYDALRAITINAAEHIGVADRVGSLETGKDADLVICKGSPMEISGVVKYVFINGELVE